MERKKKILIQMLISKIQTIQDRGQIVWNTIQDWILGKSDKWNAKVVFRL